MRLAMYIVGQERRLVNPPSQVVAGVRTVTTQMDGRDALPRLSRPSAFCVDSSISIFPSFERTRITKKQLRQEPIRVSLCELHLLPDIDWAR